MTRSGKAARARDHHTQALSCTADQASSGGSAAGVRGCQLIRLRGAGKTSHHDIRAAAGRDREPHLGGNARAHPHGRVGTGRQLACGFSPVRARRSRQAGQARQEEGAKLDREDADWVEKKDGLSRLL